MPGMWTAAANRKFATSEDVARYRDPVPSNAPLVKV